MTVRGYQLASDWGRTGAWTGVYDDVTSDVDNTELVVSVGRDTASATSTSPAGKLNFALKNLDRLYSLENADSPLYGQVLPGVPVRLQKTHNNSIYTLFDGTWNQIDADPGGAAKTVTGEALDAWGRLGAQTLSTAVHQSVRTGDAIDLVLDEIGWTGGRDLDAGATVMPWWWEEGTDAATAVDRIVASEGPPAIAYVDAGTFVFRDRHHRLIRTESTTSQGTFTHIEPAGSGPAGDYKILRGSFQYDHGLKSIANSVTFDVEQRVPEETAEVWSSEDALTVSAGQSVTVVVQASDPFINATTPVAGLDYVLASGAATVALSRTSGQSATLTVSASSDAVLTRLALRANPVAVARTVKVTAEDQASISTFERRTWQGEHGHGFAAAEDALSIARRIVAIYGQARPTVTFAIAYTSSLPDRYLTTILGRRISDRITVRNDRLGMNTDFMIERLTHTIIKLGAIHRLEIGCQVVDPGQPAAVFTFGVAGKGFNDGAFGVDGIDNPTTMFRFDTAGQGFNQGVFAS